MEKFEVVEIEGNKNLLNHYKTYEIKKKDKSMMNDEDVKMFYNFYKRDDKRCLVIGQNPTRWTTLKKLDEKDLKMQKDDYWKNKVEDPEKFMLFERIQISFLEHKKIP
jgi:hypothetical protein